MNLKRLSIFLLLFSCQFSIAQLTELGRKCSFDSDEINLKLNNWNLERSDYSHEKFIKAIGKKASQNINFEGPRDQEEFGHPWFYYNNDLGDSIHFAGVIEGDDLKYKGNNRIFSFNIKSRKNFNLNGVRVGDPISKVKNLFSRYCEEDDQFTKIFIFYDYSTLGFFYDSKTKLISEINLYTRL